MSSSLKVPKKSITVILVAWMTAVSSLKSDEELNVLKAVGGRGCLYLK